MKRTYSTKVSEVERKWHVLDARRKVLGRLAVEAGKLLIGKHKVNYVPNLDVGDYVVVVNAKDVAVTGRKEEQKVYRRHSQYPGGLKERTLGQLREKQPEKIIEAAVRGMLPKNRLQRRRMKRLKVFAGEKHPYEDKIKQ